MPTRTNRRWLVARKSDGTVSRKDFKWVEEPVGPVADGQFLVANLWLSCDPTQILQIGSRDPGNPESGGVAIGEVMTTIAVSQVIESKHPSFHPGELVHGHMGWEDYTVTDGTGFTPTYRVPDGVAPDVAVGLLGISGMAGYFGLVEVGRPKAGETLVVNGAAGGVGSVVVQVATILGLRVVAIAGSAAKCDWLRDDVGVEVAINYHTEDLAARLSASCPEGIDLFFENSGGATTLDLVLQRLRTGGRVILCGGTTVYPLPELPPGPKNLLSLIMASGRIEGVLARDFVPRFPEAFAVMIPWIRSGKLKLKADVLVGLENAPDGLARMFEGENVGKQLVKLRDPSPG
jgi:NADPH-dependent curcumin reductase